MTAAIYVRVSKQKQEYDMQLTELREFARRSGWDVVEYKEKASSVKLRPILELLLNDCRLKRVDVVLVWKLDRFGRSVRQIVNNVMNLDRLGIRFVAVTQGIDTDKQNPMGKFLMHIMAAFAELERDMIVDRVNAGVAEAKRQGKHCGRPPRVFRREEVLKLKKQGLSVRKIAAELGVPKSSVERVLKGVSKPLPK